MKNTSAAVLNPISQPSPRKEVIERCLPLVKSIAARVRLASGLRAPFDDLYAAGVTGLLEAAERFDPSRGIAFTTFAYYRIRGAILDSQRNERRHPKAASAAAVPLSPDVLELRIAANDNAVARPEQEDTSTPSWAFASTAPIQLVPFDVLDSMEDETAPHPDEEVERKWRSDRVRAALATLPDLERRVLELHYYEDESFAGISAQLGMCKPWAFRLHARALRMLRDALGEAADLDGDDDQEDSGGEED
jgi:RNA polymerase sigma factor for flagellar operon FliA